MNITISTEYDGEHKDWDIVPGDPDQFDDLDLYIDERDKGLSSSGSLSRQVRERVREVTNAATATGSAYANMTLPADDDVDLGVHIKVEL